MFVSVPHLTRDFDYSLPENLIARHPPAHREDARMMVLHRAAQTIEHRGFRDFPSFVREGDLVVLNDTRVIAARVFSDDGRIELLFVEEVRDRTWKCLVKPGRKMQPGALVHVRDVPGVVVEICPDGERIIEFRGMIDLDAAGEMPLPPYLEREVEPADAERYQTVFARERGAIAAPTAGLHFTPEILARVPHAFVTLHVGVGTFRPVQVENLADHRMHAERYRIGPEAAARINAAQRILAVGTTTTRVLEALGRPFNACVGATDIFIHPPHEFHVVDGLLTNFHLPKSTLLMLVAAFAGRDFILHAYAEAIREQYRFYSYGDCMLIL
jgi:S-adenosylmethionine:tRNA ribosyltransferase-isomerase